MLLDIGYERVDRFADYPLQTTPKGFAERFDLEADAFRATEQFFSRERALYRAYEDAGEALFKATGQRLPNPLSTPEFEVRPFPLVSYRAKAMERFRAALIEARRDHPEIPDPDRIEADVEARAKAAHKAAQLGALVSDPWGDVGGFLGTMWGALTDPVNLATLPFGAFARLSGGVAMRILKQALVEAAIGGGTQAVIETKAAPWREKLGVEGSPLVNILAVAGGAALLGGAARGLIEGVRAVRGARLPLPERDAAIVLDRALSDIESNPMGRENSNVHQMALELAEREVARGRHAPEMPVEAAPARAAAEPVASGPRSTVYTAAGRGVDVELEVVEASALTTSHLDDMKPNPVYPVELQPRDRSRATSETQIVKIAKGLQPERLGASPDAATGAPIVGPDNVVESGNGRLLALRRAYAEADPSTAAAYREFIRSQGFDPSQFVEPVLIRRRVSALGPEARIAFAREANASPAMAMAAAERALSDARTLNKILPLHQGGDIGSAANREFVRAFVRGLPETESASMFDKGGVLSLEGRRRLEAALLARAYGDEAPGLLGKLLESQDNDIKAIGGALSDVSGPWAMMRIRAATGEIAAGMDITADLIAAVRMVEKARSRGEKIADLLAQGNLFGGGMTENARALLASFFRDYGFRRPASRKAIAERLLAYVREAEKTTPGADIFGEAPPTAVRVLAATDPRKAQRLMFVQEAHASVDRMEAGEIDEAALQEARRVAASEDPAVELDDGTRKKASDLLDEAEEKKRVAKEIADACVFGRAAE